MPYARWFGGIQLNYAEHIFRKATRERPAIIFQREGGPLQEVSWQELSHRVTSLQHFLKAHGVEAGDRVAAYMPCIPEAIVAFLAVNGLGAVWSSCSPDFGTNSVIDRFAQIAPKVLLAVDHYVYGGKTFDKTDVVRDVVAAIPSLEHVVVLNDSPTVQSSVPISSWRSVTETHTGTPEFVRVPFGHPIWILYSSGTTGLPKAIVHSQGGILLEHLKYGTFHNDFREGERCFWYTTTGWMMWNYIQSSLLAGSTLVLYDGSPGYPDLTVLWKFVQDAGIHHFGTSAGFILANLKGGVQPGRDFNLSTLRSIGSTGSTLPPEGFEWVYNSVKPDVWLASMSGGTDVQRVCRRQPVLARLRRRNTVPRIRAAGWKPIMKTGNRCWMKWARWSLRDLCRLCLSTSGTTPTLNVIPKAISTYTPACGAMATGHRSPHGRAL